MQEFLSAFENCILAWEGACTFRGGLIWVVQRNQEWIVQEFVGAPRVPPHPWSEVFLGWVQAEAALEPLWWRCCVSWVRSSGQWHQDTPVPAEPLAHSCLLCFLLVLSNVSDPLCAFRKEILHMWIPFSSAVWLGTEHFNTSVQSLWGHSGKVELEVKSLLYSDRQLQHK